MLRAIIVDTDPEARAAIRRMLARHATVSVVGEFEAVTEAIHKGAARRPDVILVEAPRAEDAAVDALAQLAAAFPDAAILLTAAGASADFAVRSIRAGALEVIARPVVRTELLAALDKVTRVRGGRPAPRVGRITAVFSPKGGVGVTTVASNLSVCLAQRGGEILFVELDTRGCDAAVFLDLRPTYSVLDAFENLERMDEMFLRSLLVRHASGLWVLPGPAHPVRFALTADQVRSGLEVMRAHFDHVVLDLRHDLEPATVAALEAADTALMLSALDVVALRATARTIAALGVEASEVISRLRIVIVRDGTDGDVTVKDAREALGLPVFWRVPNDYHLVAESINTGRPFVLADRRSKLAGSLRSLTATLVDGHGSAAAPSRTSRSFFDVLWGAKRVAKAG